MLQIGPYRLQSQVLLAPMAGVTDLPFRKLCRKFGAGLTTAEMLTSDTRLWHSDKSRHRLAFNEETSPISVQIAGSDPFMLADAAQKAVEHGAQIIDINMGCPAKKVCKKLAGSALLKNESLVYEILKATVTAVNVPVTLKTRTGWDKNQKNGVKVAMMAEDLGIKAIAIHGRTRACKFAGNADYDSIAEIAEAVTIPVIANGDIDSPTKAKYVLDRCNTAAVMIGRAALGNPWIFSKTVALLNGNRMVNDDNIGNTIASHLLGLYQLYGEYKGIRIARKHFSWYCETLRKPKSVTSQFNKLDTTESQIEAVQEVFAQHINHEEKAA